MNILIRPLINVSGSRKFPGSLFILVIKYYRKYNAPIAQKAFYLKGFSENTRKSAELTTSIGHWFKDAPIV